MIRSRRALVLAAVLLLGCPSADDDDDDVTPAPEPQPPGAMTVAISPDDPTSSEDFLVQVTSASVDPDGDLAGTRYEWRVDGVLRDGGGAAISAASTLRGEVWEVTATPYDDAGLEGPSATAEVTIGNSPPLPPLIRIIPDSPAGGVDPMACLVDEDSVDVDGDAVTYSVLWEVDGEAYPQEEHSGPLTALLDGDTVPAEDSGPDQLWACRITPADGTDEGDAAVAKVSTGEAPPPEPMEDFSLVDHNATSATFDQVVSPRDYLEAVSGWYFGHST